MNRNLKKIINMAKKYSEDSSIINKNTIIFKELSMNSIEWIRFLGELESEFKIEFNIYDIDIEWSIEELFEYIMRV